MLTGRATLGDVNHKNGNTILMVIDHVLTSFYWAAAELAISIVSICLPNMTQLFRRAHRHGFSALFTRREYVADIRSNTKRGTAGPTLVHGREGGFRPVSGWDGTTFAANDDPLVNAKDQSSFYSVSLSVRQSQSEEGDIIALGQVHLQ